MSADEKRGHWDREQQEGKWTFLDSVDEMPRLAITAGLIAFCPEPDVLDLGCGTGALLRFLGKRARSYTGVDVSSKLIEQAKEQRASNTTFLQADFDQLTLTTAFDVIVFGESLFYARDPSDCLVRFSRHLKADGFMIVSMWLALDEPEFAEYRQRSENIWNFIEQSFEVLHDISATKRDYRWDPGLTRQVSYRVKAIKPKHA